MPRKTINPAALAHHEKKSQAPATLPETGFVRLSTILRIYPVGRSTWWAGCKSGKYPSGVKIGPNTTAWRVEDIKKLLDSAQRGEA